MKTFLQTLKQTGEMDSSEAANLFGWDVIEAAYNKGRITFEGNLIVFLQ